MDSQLKGDLAELRYSAKLKELGYTVLFPFTEGQHYDLVVDTGDDMVRVQVKSSNTLGDEDKRVKFNCYNSSTSKSGNATYYTKDMIDGLGVYNGELDKYFYVPVEEMNKNTMTLSPKDDAKNQFDDYRLERIK